MDVNHIPHSQDAPYSHSPPTQDTRQPRGPCLTSDIHPCDLGGHGGLVLQSCLSQWVHTTFAPRPYNSSSLTNLYPHEPGGAGLGQGVFHTSVAEATCSVSLTPSLPSASHSTSSPAPDGGFLAEDVPPPTQNANFACNISNDEMICRLASPSGFWRVGQGPSSVPACAGAHRGGPRGHRECRAADARPQCQLDR
jgi:hypothetical protein